MKQTRIALIIYVTFHFLYLLLGFVVFFILSSWMEDAQFFVPMIYGSFLIATTINTSINTVRHGVKRSEKHRQELKQTSFGTETPQQEHAKKRYAMTTLFWIVNGILTFVLSLLMIAFSAIFTVRSIFRNILDQGGSVDLESYDKIQDALTFLDRFILVFLILLLGGMIASIIVRMVSNSKAKRLMPQKEAPETPSPQNEEIPMEVPQEANNASETPESVVLPPTEAVEHPQEPALDEIKPEPEPVEPKIEPIVEEPKPIVTPVEEKPIEKIRPEQIMPPKEEAKESPEYLEEIKPLVIKVKSKQMILNLPNPPTFIALPGIPNVAWVQDEALVIYFDYTSKIKSILEECVKNNPKKFPFSHIEKIVLEGPEGRESTAFYYTDNKTSQKIVFPKACYEVLINLVPMRGIEPKKQEPKAVVEEKPTEPTLPEPQVEKTKQVPPPMIKPTPVNPNDPEVRLAKLQKLYEKNIISKEEYDKKRQEILDTF